MRSEERVPYGALVDDELPYIVIVGSAVVARAGILADALAIVARRAERGEHAVVARIVDHGTELVVRELGPRLGHVDLEQLA